MASAITNEVPVYDFIVIGAGIAGINAAYLLKTETLNMSYIVFENRERVGGTWDFWKYPGIRSDSFLSLFGLTWHQWPHDMDFADAHLIRDYLEDAVRVQGIDKHIRQSHRVDRAEWSSKEQLWTVRVTPGNGNGETQLYKSRFILSCTGYYDYDKPLEANIPGIKNFKGQVIHPQFWTPDIDYAGKKIVLIGSGATAVTLLPNLAKAARHITMLQRSPSYVLTAPSRDRLSLFFLRWLPTWLALSLNWYRHNLLETFHVWLMRNFPNWGKKQIMVTMSKALPSNIDVNEHFNPSYAPYNQRLCLCPDNDFFDALHRPNCDIITDHIDMVTENGLRLKSGKFLEADMIITTTGLSILFLGGIPTLVDGEEINDKIGERYVWNGMMLEGVPNLGMTVTYTEATAPPGTFIRVRQLLKVAKHVYAIGATSATPYVNNEERKRLPVEPSAKISSTYIVTTRNKMPIAAGISPWRTPKNYFQDWKVFKFGNLNKGLKFGYANSKP